MSDDDLAAMGREQIAIMRAVEQERSLGAHRLARIAELERAAEVTRAEHAAALGLATARIRELEGERDELLGMLGASEFEEKCGRIMWGPAGVRCSDEIPCAEHRRRARIEKATKGKP